MSTDHIYISDQSHDYTQSNTTRCHSDAVVCRWHACWSLHYEQTWTGP